MIEITLHFFCLFLVHSEIPCSVRRLHQPSSAPVPGRGRPAEQHRAMRPHDFPRQLLQLGGEYSRFAKI